jgi:hypothetical protein
VARLGDKEGTAPMGGVEWRVAWAALVIGNDRGVGSGNDGSAGKLERREIGMCTSSRNGAM